MNNGQRQISAARVAIDASARRFRPKKVTNRCARAPPPAYFPNSVETVTDNEMKERAESRAGAGTEIGMRLKSTSTVRPESELKAPPSSSESGVVPTEK
ncbi:hypothetical protein EVAR_12269_1 [Eumeta japonica]|uniref:Uncharacterized protein n=1 Tax=Eumeta variegata TaxID=151549 RepID=A0A4C1TU82_EUMVA|nr:hypothetical protein EVAR_12269_1 [Eumeta japonica]